MTIFTKSYSELIKFPSFEERLAYLKLDGTIGEETFGFKRWVNQQLYHSAKWLKFRDKVIIRDCGCDLAMSGYEIYGSVLIHHLNPVTYDDILNLSPCLFDFDNVILTCLATHNAIHYGNDSLIIKSTVGRSPNDTCPWRK